MGRSNPKRRKMKIQQKQKRQKKLGKLREKYVESGSKTRRKKILDKVFKLAPWLTKEKFLEPVKEELE
jgi:hypothetical protein